MESTIVTMTPEWASSILNSQNDQNRSVRPNAVKKIATAILSGDWKVTHQGIAIGTNGQLLDGQHRLNAIVAAGISVDVLLATNCDPASFDVLDCGVNRTAADTLRLSGSSLAAKSAAGLKYYLLYKRDSSRVWTNIDLPPHTEILKTYIEKRDLVDHAASIAQQAYQGDRIINQSAMVAFQLLVIDKSWHFAGEQFCALLGNPVMQPQYSPILAYHKLLKNATSIDKRYLQQRSLASMIKCFNYWVQDLPLKIFKQPQISPMPQIIKAFPNQATQAQ
jgi:hypothetical protein